MNAGDWAYIAISAQPFGGLLASIPLAIFALEYPWWLVLLSGPPLAYVQVVAVDLGWSALLRWGWFRRTLEGKRSPRVERLLAGQGAFWATFTAAPLIGPWVVMGFMRYANVPQRRVALPIYLSMVLVAAITTAACVWLPALFQSPG